MGNLPSFQSIKERRCLHGRRIASEANVGILNIKQYVVQRLFPNSPFLIDKPDLIKPHSVESPQSGFLEQYLGVNKFI